MHILLIQVWVSFIGLPFGLLAFLVYALVILASANSRQRDSSIGAIRRKSWGRWLYYGFSVLILPFVPLGTIVGGLMIYHLTVHRDQFGRSSQNLSNNG